METADNRLRGIFSFLFIGLYLGPIFAMLWLGKGKLALFYLLATIVFYLGIAALVGYGLISFAPIPVSKLLTSFAFDSTMIFHLVGVLHSLRIRETSAGRPWFRWLAIVPAVFPAIPLLLLIPIRIFLFQPFSMPSRSNIPNLIVGDYIFVSKSAYGYSRYSFPLNLANFDGRIWGADPKRGDLAVFKLPTNTEIDYVKRVVGLPGDRIQMRDGILFIDGEAVKKERIKDYVDSAPLGEGGGHPIQQYEETLPNGIKYRVLDEQPNGQADNTIEYVVPAGHYFTMGDNRDNSEDSRFLDSVGYVPVENFVGPVVLLFWNSKGMPLGNRP